MNDLYANYDSIHAAVSRMELELLGPLLKRRSEIVAAAVEWASTRGTDTGEARDVFDRVAGQNTRLRIRLHERRNGRDAELRELHDLARCQDTYRR